MAVRELPDFFKTALHTRLDELIAMYERGEPLWIVGEDKFTSTTSEGVKVRIDFRDEWS